MLAELVTTASPAAGHRRRWFAAGEARLAIDVPASGTASEEGLPSLHDAVLLAEHDRLLRALAERCGEDFAWRPIASPEPSPEEMPADEALTFSLAAPGEGLRAGVHLPPELHDALSGSLEMPVVHDVADGKDGGTTDGDGADVGANEVEGEGGGDGGVWIIDNFPFVSLEIERFALSAEDVERVAVGAVVLLPASFGGAWSGTLRLVSSDGGPDGVGGGGSTGTSGGTEPVPDLALPVRLSLEGDPGLVPLGTRPGGAGKGVPVEAVPPRARDGSPAFEGPTCTVTALGVFRVPLSRWVDSGEGDRPPVPWSGPESTSFVVAIENGRDGEGGSAHYTGSIVRLYGGYGVLLAAADPR